MAQKRLVTLQINVAPTDYPHAVNILPHQLRQWGGQVDEVLFTYDLHRTAYGGRFGEGWEERRGPMTELLQQLCASNPKARVGEVDYGPERSAEIAAEFTGGEQIPPKDTKGAPYYPYLHGLADASNDLILHMDSDLMFGGGSQGWIAEGCSLLEEHEQVLATGPLPGPPSPDGALHTQRSDRFPLPSPAFRFDTFTSRLFLIDRRRLLDRLAPLPLLGPVRTISGAKARLHGNPPYRAAELAIGDAMAAAGMERVDFLGSAPGMWSLHPPFRSPEFYDELPRLISSIEAGEVPDAQLGDYELNDSMFDWSPVRRRAMLRRLWA